MAGCFHSNLFRSAKFITTNYFNEDDGTTKIVYLKRHVLAFTPTYKRRLLEPGWAGAEIKQSL
jgi:hypothetical protein